ncbi:MAG: hypothetical protein M3463_04230 [Verrucomicrobiota bacterium]|nr:hypothetical protein [Verrucomicrobiota bacterium]
MNPNSPPLSPEEQDQVLQTIEMFEVIVEGSPQDVQSLEILKDAYHRVGKLPEMLATSRKLAEQYTEAGQHSSALLEYEGILQHDPDNPEIIAALGEVEERLHESGEARPVPMVAPPETAVEVDVGFNMTVDDTGTLMATGRTLRSVPVARMETVSQALKQDGNEPLAKFLIQHRLAPEEAVRASLEHVMAKNKDLPPNTLATSLLEEVASRGSLAIDGLLSGILERSKFAYIPLEHYDVDRHVVRSLPETLTLGRLIVPFDRMSRTVLIATANPFDAAGKEAVQQLLDDSVQWHLASPAAIVKALSDTYRIAAPSPDAVETAQFRLAS